MGSSGIPGCRSPGSGGGGAAGVIQAGSPENVAGIPGGSKTQHGMRLRRYSTHQSESETWQAVDQVAPGVAVQVAVGGNEAAGRWCSLQAGGMRVAVWQAGSRYPPAGMAGSEW